MSRRVVLFILICIILIAGGLRLYGLDQQSLWYDEFVEESAFKQLFLHHYPPMPIENTPPLNSFFIYLMTEISPDSVFAMRIVPLTFGLMSIPLLFLLGRQLFNEEIGLIASFLLAISPFHIWYSQDARMYALMWMLSLISLLYFIRALERPGTGNYMGFILSTVAGLYTHQLTLFLLLLEGIYLLLFIQKYKSQFLKWTCSFSAVIILYLPWIIYSLTSLMDRSTGHPKQVDLKAVIYTIFTYCAGFSFGPSLRELHMNPTMTTIMPYLTEIISIMIIFSILFILGLWSIRKDRSRLLFLLNLQIVPIVGAIILNKILPNVVYNARYTGIALFAFLLFVANGINWLRHSKPDLIGRILAASAVIVITAFSAYSYANYQFDIRYHKADYRGAAIHINENKMSNDTVLCVMADGIITRYAGGGFRCTKFWISSTKDEAILASVMQKIIKGKDRIWLVSSNEWYMDSIVKAKEWLDINYEEINQLHKGIDEIANVSIYCYDLQKKKPIQLHSTQ